MSAPRKSSTTSSPKGRTPTRPRFGLTSLTLRSLPELDLFDTPEQREAALREIEGEASDPRSFEFWFGVMLVATAPLLTFYISRAFLRRVIQWLGVPLLDRAVEWLLVAGAAWLTLRTLHHRGMTSAVREKLIERDIPVCRGCGYLLRGLLPDSGPCPECGRNFDEDAVRLLRTGQGHGDLAAGHSTAEP